MEKTGIHSSDLFNTLLPMLEEGHRAAFTVSGMSMWPFLCHGRDQAVLEACSPSSLHVGDILLVQTPKGNYLLHRITKLRADAFETTGDGNCFRDGWFSFDCAKARTAAVIRKGRTISCAGFRWRMAFRFWSFLYPVRGLVLCLLVKIGRFKAGIRSWKKKKGN